MPAAGPCEQLGTPLGVRSPAGGRSSAASVRDAPLGALAIATDPWAWARGRQMERQAAYFCTPLYPCTRPTLRAGLTFADWWQQKCNVMFEFRHDDFEHAAALCGTIPRPRPVRVPVY